MVIIQSVLLLISQLQLWPVPGASFFWWPKQWNSILQAWQSRNKAEQLCIFVKESTIRCLGILIAAGDVGAASTRDSTQQKDAQLCKETVRRKVAGKTLQPSYNIKSTITPSVSIHSIDASLHVITDNNADKISVTPPGWFHSRNRRHWWSRWSTENCYHRSPCPAHP